MRALQTSKLLNEVSLSNAEDEEAVVEDDEAPERNLARNDSSSLSDVVVGIAAVGTILERST